MKRNFLAEARKSRNIRNSQLLQTRIENEEYLYDLEKYNEAIQSYEEALKSDPKEKTDLMNKAKYSWNGKGIALTNLGRYDEALQCFDEALKLDSKYKEALIGKGICRFNVGQYADSIQYFSEALKLNPQCKEAFFNKGNSLHALGNYHEAIQCYDEALKIEGNYIEALYNKGNSLFELRKYVEAIQCYDEAINLEPTHKLAWNNKGFTFNKMEKHDEAIQCFDEAIKLDANFKRAWFNKGEAYSKLGKGSEAIRSFDEVTKLDPKDIDGWYHKGSEYFKLNSFRDAIRAFDVVIKLDLNRVAAWNKKGLSLYKLGRYNEVVQCFDQSIKLNPSDKKTWHNKGVSLQHLGKYNESLQCFDEALKLDPNFLYPWRDKGNSLLKLERLDEALKCFTKLIQSSATKEAWNYKGRAYKKKGEYDNAIKCFNESLKIDPNYEPALINIERINKVRTTPSKEYIEKCLDEIKNDKADLVDFGDLRIGDSECKRLRDYLKVNYSLKELNLEDNNIGNQGAKYLYEALQINNSLQQLNLNLNCIDDLNLLNSISEMLEKNKNATRISHLKSSANINWVYLILNQKNIKVLALNNCNLTELPKRFDELQELETLDLQHNQLTEIPDLSKLNKLVICNLSKNKIKFEFKENNIYLELSSFLESRIPTSLSNLLLQKNEGLVGYLTIIDIILHKEKLENEIESSSKLFFWICYMNKLDIPFEKLMEIVKNLKESYVFDFSSRQLSIIPAEAELYKLENFCLKLIFEGTELKEIPESIFLLTKLKSLRLQKSNLSSIPEGISKLENLKEIALENNRFTEFPIILSKLKSLQSIWMDRNLISHISMNYDFSNLERVSISQNKLSNLGGIISWTTLQVLILNENEIKLIPKEIKNLKKLKKLHLNKNKLKILPTEIGELKELIELQIRENLLEELPVTIGELINLGSLDVSNNFIKSIPASIGNLEKLNTLNVKGNPIKSPPIEFTNNINDLKGYWMDLSSKGEKCNYLKLIIIGEENVGKTTLVKALNIYNTSTSFSRKSNMKKEFNNKPLSTDGISISMQPLILPVENFYNLPNNQLILNIWDFGGQEIYHSTHIFFLSSNAIYLIVWDMSKKEEEINRLLFWVQTIHTYVNNPIIILVGTHLDLCSSKNLDPVYEIISNRSGIPKEFIVGISSKTGKNFDTLIKLVKLKALNEEGISEIKLPEKLSKTMAGQMFPKIYFNLKNLIDEESKKRLESSLPPILSLKELQLLAEKINILREDELKRGLLFLHSLGFCLYFSNDKELSNYVILNSQWLADTMATLFTTKSNFIQKGLLDHQHFKQVWKEPKYHSKIHPLLIEILQKFNILIPITHDSKKIYIGQSVVPALLSNESKPIDLISYWAEGKKIKIQRIYQFNSFLPSQIFPQFMATIFSLFGFIGVNYWRDGVLIIKEKMRCLIELDPLNKFIIISFIGKQFISLFRQIQIRLEMVLNKWENLSLDIYLTCPKCSNSSSSNKNRCFKLIECFDAYSHQTEYIFCNSISQKTRSNKILLKNLIPELSLGQIKHLIEWNTLEIENKIGEGAFADVFKGKYEHEIVAIKKLKTDTITIENKLNEESIREFLLEIGFLSYGKHNNLLQFIGIVLSPPCIVLPFANYGSLYSFLKSDKHHLSFQLFLRIGLDISLGLNYLHSSNPSIIHCDLKSANVLMMNIDYNDINCVCKISDFGLAQFSVGKFLVHKKINPIWAAPEVLEGTDQSVQSDIYSFGMVLYELLTKDIPYSPDQNPDWKFMQKVETSILEGVKPIYSKEKIESDFKTEIPNSVYQTMELCWDRNPTNRPSSEFLIATFYSLLSKHWSEIKMHIVLPKMFNN